MSGEERIEKQLYLKKTILMNKSLLGITLAFFIFQACQTKTESNESGMPKSYFAIEEGTYGKLPSGETVKHFTLKSPSGMEVGVTNYGAVITSWLAPNKAGRYENVVIGFDSVDGYIKNPSYFGAVVGRYGNRIANGQFSIDGVDYQLAINNSPNNLHGGDQGFDKVLWETKEFVNDSSVGLVLTYFSKDMEEGFPGNLTTQVTYTLTGDDALAIDYYATTDRTTHVNLTQHSYFNLSGNVSRDVLGHKLMINAGEITPVDATLIPTGSLMPVDGTPLDFREATVIGERINDDHSQIKFGHGYDHNWVLDSTGIDKNGLTLAAVLTDSISGRKMEVFTQEPGIQFYSGNFMNAETMGNGGVVFDYRHGLCLETQHFPDTPNQPQFPSTLLNPGEEYRTRTIYKFGVE